MVGCSAYGCANSSLKNVRLYRFPSDPIRRLQWQVNCRRDTKNWKPNENSRICEIHFEESQFEAHRLDGRRKPKPNAVPTLFNVRNSGERLRSRTRKVERLTSQTRNCVAEGSVPAAAIDENTGSNTVQPAPLDLEVHENETPLSLEEQVEYLQKKLCKLDEENKRYCETLKTTISNYKRANKILTAQNKLLENKLKDYEKQQSR